MWVELFLCLLLAHLVADFVLQTTASCKSKAEKHWQGDVVCLGSGAACVRACFDGLAVVSVVRLEPAVGYRV